MLKQWACGPHRAVPSTTGRSRDPGHAIRLRFPRAPVRPRIRGSRLTTTASTPSSPVRSVVHMRRAWNGYENKTSRYEAASRAHEDEWKPANDPYPATLVILGWPWDPMSRCRRASAWRQIDIHVAVWIELYPLDLLTYAARARRRAGSSTLGAHARFLVQVVEAAVLGVTPCQPPLYVVELRGFEPLTFSLRRWHQAQAPGLVTVISGASCAF